MKILQQLIKNPVETGAIAVSSKKLAQIITDTTNLKTKKCVVELGPGTGIFTKEILKKISPNTVFFSLEINQVFVLETQKNCPAATVYHASAQNIATYLKKHNQRKSDCIISGLPWAAFESNTQQEILNKVYASMEKGGEFLTFAYLQGLIMPQGKRFKDLLKTTFNSVNKTKIIWRNTPPAIVYHCIK